MPARPQTPPRLPEDRRPRQRRSTAAEVAATDAARAEAEAEALTSDWVTVPLPDGTPIRLRPFLRWPRGTYRALIRSGDFEAIEDVVHPDDQAAFAGWDCEIGDLIDWTGEVVARAGQSRGEYRASKRS